MKITWTDKFDWKLHQESDNENVMPGNLESFEQKWHKKETNYLLRKILGNVRAKNEILKWWEKNDCYEVFYDTLRQLIPTISA